MRAEPQGRQLARSTPGGRWLATAGCGVVETHVVGDEDVDRFPNGQRTRQVKGVEAAEGRPLEFGCHIHTTERDEVDDPGA